MDLTSAELRSIVQEELRRSPMSVLVRQIQGSVLSGIGSPEGIVPASVGVLYRRADGGAATTLYVKETGAGNTGWVAK